VWIRPFGRLLYVMPPYIIAPDELHALTDAMVELAAAARVEPAAASRAEP
jgi:adenosylmethionine-8-amino-7-oxononanoate aminotransferase